MSGAEVQLYGRVEGAMDDPHAAPPEVDDDGDVTMNGSASDLDADGEVDADGEADADGEVDAEYDSVSPSAVADSRQSCASEPSIPAKRKASVEDDKHIAENPELYGLRRSVRAVPHGCVH